MIFTHTLNTLQKKNIQSTLGSRPKLAHDNNMSTKFLGGMRGLTKFVEKIRNCANQVRARQSNSCIRARIRFLLGPDGRESAKISRNEEREREREREPSEIFAQIS